MHIRAVAAAALTLSAYAQWPPPGPETAWLSAAGHGVFTHYLEGLQNEFGPNSQGRNTTWSAAVAEFDVEAYAASAAAAGARYAIITMMQGSKYMLGPNMIYDGFTGYAPGEACSQRDLIADLAPALAARGIRLMLYWTGDGPHMDQQASTGLGWPEAPTSRSNVPLVFAQRWAAVMQEYAERYAGQVSGWWVDGCYTYFNYTEEKLAPYLTAVRAGNPAALLALNHGVMHPISRYSRWEDYTCGESNDFTEIPASRFVNGSQWHTLSFLGTAWAAPGERYNASALGEYIGAVNGVGGAVTVDVQLLRNGSMNAAQTAVVGAAVREAKMSAAAASAATAVAAVAASATEKAS